MELLYPWLTEYLSSPEAKQVWSSQTSDAFPTPRHPLSRPHRHLERPPDHPLQLPPPLAIPYSLAITEVEKKTRHGGTDGRTDGQTLL